METDPRRCQPISREKERTCNQDDNRETGQTQSTLLWFLTKKRSSFNVFPTQEQRSPISLADVRNTTERRRRLRLHFKYSKILNLISFFVSLYNYLLELGDLVPSCRKLQHVFEKEENRRHSREKVGASVCALFSESSRKIIQAASCVTRGLPNHFSSLTQRHPQKKKIEEAEGKERGR